MSAPGEFSERLQIAREDAQDACADALLAATGVVLLSLGYPDVTLPLARSMAIAALDRVIERTQREGARPR